MTAVADDRSVPFFRLSALYFFYFAIVGAFVPYWTLYLHQRGLAGMQIGVVLALTSLSRIAAPNVWGWVADRTGQHTRVLRWGALFTATLFAFLASEPEYSTLLVVVCAYSVFWNAILPQIEVVTLVSLSGDTRRYGRARVWGSLSFIVFVVALGWWFDRADVRQLPVIVVALMWMLWIVTLVAPAVHRQGTPRAWSALRGVLASRKVRVFLLVSLLGQVAQAGYYSFFTLRLEMLGVAREISGYLWAVGVVAEILLFLAMHRILARVSLKFLLLVAFIAGTLRWLIIGLVPDMMPLLVLAQLGHAATFGILHSVSIEFIHRHFPAEVAGQGQALYSAVSYGVGGVLGNLVAGWLWDHAGPGSPFLFAAIVSAAATLMTARFFSESDRDAA